MTDSTHSDDPLLPGQAATVPERDAPVLTGRQRQILELLRAGKVNKEIANELGIGLGTVKQHVVAIFKKLKVRNR
ncbi:partial Putative HTH-type transcriptional regulator YhjB, partial [Rhodocyclaceae bacterium]